MEVSAAGVGDEHFDLKMRHGFSQRSPDDLVGAGFDVGHVECFLQGRFVAPPSRLDPARVFAAAQLTTENQRGADREGGRADIRDEGGHSATFELPDAGL